MPKIAAIPHFLSSICLKFAIFHLNPLLFCQLSNTSIVKSCFASLLTQFLLIKANSLIFATHPFSKGTHKQKDAIQSVGKHYVSKSVGLIRIAGRLSGTGFRVGSKYVATCYHLIKKIITGL